MLQQLVTTSQPPANMQSLGLVSVLNHKRYSAETRHHQITDTAEQLVLQAIQGTGNSGAEVYAASFITTNDDNGRPDYMVGYGTVCIPSQAKVEQNVSSVDTDKDSLSRLEETVQNLVSQRDAALAMIDQLVRWADRIGRFESPCWSQARDFVTGNSSTVVNDGSFGLTAEQLEDKYGHREHPDYIRDEWRDDVDNGDTNLGYWDWVLHQVESHYSDNNV